MALQRHETLYYMVLDVFKHNKLPGFRYFPFKLKIICISNCIFNFVNQHWEMFMSWICKCNLQPNEVFIFKKKRWRNQYWLVHNENMCVYIFSFLTLLDHYVKCIFVHNIYWLEKFRLSIERNSISVIDYIYPNLLIFSWFVLRDRTLFFWISR